MDKIHSFSTRQCAVCEGKLVGRSDKVFCDIKCKNYYHLQLRKHTKTETFVTNKILAKNYQIISGLMSERTIKMEISKIALQNFGFQFGYFTQWINSNSFGLYEFQLSFQPNNTVQIRTSEKRKQQLPFIFNRWKNTFANHYPT